MIDKLKENQFTVYLTHDDIEKLLNDGQITVKSRDAEIKIGRALVMDAVKSPFYRPIKAINTDTNTVTPKGYINHAFDSASK